MFHFFCLYLYSNESIILKMRYKNFKIEDTPTDTFPEMVTITKGKTINKKFVTNSKAIIWIDTLLAEQMIRKTSNGARREMEEFVVVETYDE